MAFPHLADYDCVAGTPGVIAETTKGSQYYGKYALVDYGDDLHYNQKSYWLGKDNSVNQYITLGKKCDL